MKGEINERISYFAGAKNNKKRTKSHQRIRRYINVLLELDKRHGVL